MTHKIFLSHAHSDKPIVEQVALRLAGLFGQDQVFYDSWSIRPGDGIINEMNKGLDAPEVVFFFVSANSLASGMVTLEWQNALYSATKGKTRLVPVRIDGSDVPAVLRQTLFIDMHTIGFEAAVSQIVGATQSGGSFSPQHQSFSNLAYSRSQGADGMVEIAVQASHMMEPNPNFAFPVVNEEDEVFWWIKGHPGIQGGFRKSAFALQPGGVVNAVIMRPITGSLTPKHPLIFQFKETRGTALNLIGVLHDQGDDKWFPVPQLTAQSS